LNASTFNARCGIVDRLSCSLHGSKPGSNESSGQRRC
jgi:hypothetical protein